MVKLFFPYNIFNNKISIDQSIIHYQVDKVFVPMLVHENINKQIRYNYKNSDDEKLTAIYEYYNFITDGNIIENDLYCNHNWELSNFVGILSCYSANVFLRNLKKSKYIKYNDIGNSPVLSKINYKFYNLKIINLICKKLNIDADNFQKFTQYIYNCYIFNVYSNIIVENINKYLAEYIDFIDIDKCIKLSYLYLEHKSKYTSKLKKKIEKTFQKYKK